jgi:hypothetical protein|tara:strand:- start:238 stop:471 length:234 start_codon:yes stop_codon:yes gene_type:complete
MNVKTIYQRLKPAIKITLNESARQYDSAKKLKYKLMSSSLYHELTLAEISSLMCYADVYTYEADSADVLYGKIFLDK